MTTQGKQRRRRGAEQWQQLVEAQAGGGQTVEAFCQAEGIDRGSFYRWRRRLAGGQPRNEPGQRARSQAAPAFIDLSQLAGRGANAESAGGWELELALGGGLVLRLRGR